MDEEGEAPEAEASKLTTLWRERGVLDSFDVDGSQSLAASDRALRSGLTRSVGGIKLDEGTRAALAVEPLEMGDVLGRGGMGIVHLATQQSLRREVAVKCLAEDADEAGLASLLKEAWVGGLLAHPNIAPVHALADLDGTPAIVMKRIQGVSWREVIRDPNRIPEAERGDPLGYHLRVFVAVCNAVHHAHQRGVLHLDLKPENVMLGRFGETCVVDWGLSAGWGPTSPGWMPPAYEIRSVSGTPDYMSPEIASASGQDISPRTDVYLLGATLHEVITGRAPHRGGRAIERMLRAYESAPITYPSSVPEPLVRILHRAMHKKPGERHATAEELRDDVERFVAHRRSEERLIEARERVGKLVSSVENGATEIDVARAFGAARFALGEVETERPERAALHEALHVAMARAALDAGKLALAEQYLRELGTSAADLEKRLAALQARDAERTRRVRTLEKIANEHDLDQGREFRRNTLLFFSFVLLVGNVGYGFIDRAHVLAHDYAQLLLQGLIPWIVIAGFMWVRRRDVFRNQASTAIFSIAALAFVTLQAMWASLLALDVPFRAGVAISGTVYFLAGGAATTLMSTRFYPAPMFSAMGMLLAAVLPEWAWEIFGVTSCLALGTVAVAWPREVVR